MQLTEFFTKKQIDKMNGIVDFIFNEVEPTLMDEAINYIAVSIADKKSELDKLPSGVYIMKWQVEGMLGIIKERSAE